MSHLRTEQADLEKLEYEVTEYEKNNYLCKS